MEFALVFPLVVMFVSGVVIFGIGVFNQQQLANAAREAARYAAIHSTTATYTVDSMRRPAFAQPGSYQYGIGDVPTTNPSWARMNAAGRNATFGIDRGSVAISACWSGFWQVDAAGNKVGVNAYDALPPSTSPPDTKWFNCTIGGIDPRADASAIPCPPPSTNEDANGDGVENDPLPWDDQGSAVPGNTVTVFACFQWVPPLAGFLMLPQTVTLRAVATEVIHRQQ